jgi:oxygen-independent coproporphyrinogen-3 oxidase
VVIDHHGSLLLVLVILKYSGIRLTKGRHLPNIFTSKIKSRLGNLLRQQHFGPLYVIGFLNGLLPCVLVYLGFAGAVASGDVLQGMLFMAAFGAGTLPALRSLYNLGFRRISLGIQDFDMRTQEIINRLQPFGMVASVVENARKIGFTAINFDLIYGLPLQTLTSMPHTIDKVVRLRPDRISFYSYAHVPWTKGTGQRRDTEADLPRDEEKRQLYEPGTLFDSNGYTEIGMDHFALPEEALHKAFLQGRLHRNFMGYTDSSTSLLVGLGASSIGDSWYAYAQNKKKVDACHKGAFPVVRGHILNEEDW